MFVPVSIYSIIFLKANSRPFSSIKISSWPIIDEVDKNKIIIRRWIILNWFLSRSNCICSYVKLSTCCLQFNEIFSNKETGNMKSSFSSTFSLQRPPAQQSSSVCTACQSQRHMYSMRFTWLLLKIFLIIKKSYLTWD